jgi:hypothetical protein
MPPFTVHYTFDAGGDLTLALETNPYLAGHVIAVLRNDHKRWAHAVRILDHTPHMLLPHGHCGLLDTLDAQVRDRQLLDGLHRLLDDCAQILPSGRTQRSAEDLPASLFTVRIAAEGGRCRHVTVHTENGRELAHTFVNLPDTWTDQAREWTLTSAPPFVREVAERAIQTSWDRSRRAQANSDTYQHAFGSLEGAFSGSADGPLAQWTVNGDDGGIELFLSTAHPQDSWRLLRLLEEWLGGHQMPDLTITMDETRRSVSAILRGTAPVHFVAWYRARPRP